MDLGVSELLFVGLAFGLVGLGLTIYACVRAGRNGDTSWLIGILLAWFVGAGWIVAIVYLVGVDREAGFARLTGPAPPPTGAPVVPGGQPAGWYADPRGRFELRYWDGAAWTADVSDAGRQRRDPAGI